ncbi:hypothetical protein C4D60_Mb08t10480 [Musa balbisiana]|uniref:CBF1-interacting co-repressor CIR N-terminal domain-containing protein n=1 Tax=Musa balbisiana TaxID=52838 RepID=A0A4S8K2V4_MUSBA|nr:hypothetical protein C4D60_Mb08t10480 [Musa balbisiana]
MVNENKKKTERYDTDIEEDVRSVGGHGGLNILPQKRWNGYNYENREKVRRDEEAAAREEQLQHEKSRRRDAKFCLERLHRARGLHYQQPSAFDDDSRHFNLFDDLSDFSSHGGTQDEGIPRDGKRFRKEEAEDGGSKSSKKRRWRPRTRSISWDMDW